MKKGLKCFVTILAILSVFTANVSAVTMNGYTYKTISVTGKYSDKVNNKSHKKIVRSYKDLEKLKKYIKKNYNNPTQYTKKLKKYKKSYFKKNALIFVTENVDMNQLSYKLLKLTKNNDKFVINVEKRDLLKDGYKKTAVVIYGANTYIVEAKKSKLKNVKKVKVTYKFVKNSEK